ncbi:MAG: hypothetical protein OEW52_03125 [Thermoleophilia bacterium]|nr:hypothetical protein [Thermoleophilia bacterium]MDH4339948.1 hypothetical protein [Thermoleophilia bacterium]MDH5280126.1 hypothetical protein [Thermoleophilia bacterium]
MLQYEALEHLAHERGDQLRRDAVAERRAREFQAGRPDRHPGHRPRVRHMHAIRPERAAKARRQSRAVVCCGWEGR